MKIVQIYPGKIWGGAEQYILDLSHRLRTEGHEVVMVCHDVEAVTSRLTGEPFETHALRMRWPFGGSAERAIARIIADADVVHVHDVSFVPPVSRAKARAGSDVRVVLTRHIARGSRTLPWRRRYFRGLHRMIFVSHLACRLWSDANLWMPDHLKTTIHNSIPPLAAADDSPISLRDTYGISLSTPLLVFTGRVRRSKGCEAIIRALAKICGHPDLSGRGRPSSQSRADGPSSQSKADDPSPRDFAMVFIGACKPRDYDRKLQRLADELGIGDRVHFHGFTSGVRALISEADIALAPSIVREACPLSPMEYMQQGIPVIATDNGGQAEYITDGETGMLIPPGDADALADKIALLLDNPELRETIGKQSKKYFDNHLAYYTFINKVLEVYR